MKRYISRFLLVALLMALMLVAALRQWGSDDAYDFGVIFSWALGAAAVLVVVHRFVRLVHPAEPDQDEPPTMPYNQPLTVDQAHELVDREGIVQAALRPQGNLKLDGRTLVVRSEGIFIEEGATVRIDRIEGPNIVVVPVRDEG